MICIKNHIFFYIRWFYISISFVEKSVRKKLLLPFLKNLIRINNIWELQWIHECEMKWLLTYSNDTIFFTSPPESRSYRNPWAAYFYPKPEVAFLSREPRGRQINKLCFEGIGFYFSEVAFVIVLIPFQLKDFLFRRYKRGGI